MAALRMRASEARGVRCAAPLSRAPARSRSPWSAWATNCMLDRKQLSLTAPLGNVSFWADERLLRADLAALAGERIVLTVEDQSFEVEVAPSPDGLACGRVNSMFWAASDTSAGIELQIDGSRFTLLKLRNRSPGEAKGAGAAVAPMPGTVALLPVAIGDRVAEGDVLAIVEAMKMENGVLAHAPGIVTAIHYMVGANVKAGDLLVEVEAAPAQG